MKNLFLIAVLLLASCTIYTREDYVASCIAEELSERSIFGHNPSIEAVINYCDSKYPVTDDA